MIDKISSLCFKDDGMLSDTIQICTSKTCLNVLANDIMDDQLQNSVKQLNKLCSGPQIIRPHITREDSGTTDQVNWSYDT